MKSIQYSSIIITALGSIIVIVCLFCMTSLSLAQGPWTEKTPMPTARTFLYASVVEGKIYAIGGAKSMSQYPLSTVEVYDPVTDTWDTTKTPMPTARWQHCAATVGGKIYVIGGADTPSQTTPLSTVEVYDPATDTWTTKAPMPTPREAMKCGVVNGKIYVMGGTYGPNWPCLSVVEEYDPATNTWKRKNDMNPGKWSYAVSVVDGIIYVIGGQRGAGSWNNTVQAYDPVTDTWTDKAPMQRGRTHFSASAVNGIIYAISGGTSPTNTLSRVEAYYPATDTWAPKADIPTSRFDYGIGVVNDKIYVIGGTTSWFATAISTVEAYDPNSDITSVEESISNPPTEFLLHQNYPNPFNPETLISYDVTKHTQVMLRIINLRGQQVRTLVDEDKPAGYYEVTWDGKDDHGQQVTSGVYLYRLESRGFVQTRKMILLQ